MTKIKKAIELLKSGQVVGIPTETVYGLAASIHSVDGIQKIFKTKERPFFDPLIVHVSTIEQAKSCVKNWPDAIDKLANKLWPGPVTFILEKSDSISDMISSGLDTVGIRMPNHPITLDLITQLGSPVAAPSANKFKKTSPTNYLHVKEAFPDVHTLDGGQCSVGIESTILGFRNDQILIYRPGMLNKDTLKKILNDLEMKFEIIYEQSPVAPGHLKHHYMPKIPIILFDQARKAAIQEIKDLDINLLKNPITWTLPKDPKIAARILYSKFRELDSQNYTAIMIEVSSNQRDDNEFIGILNRLQKAASFSAI